VNERRKDRRHPVEIAATVKVGKKVLTGRLLNASFNGLAIEVPDAPGTRQLVQIEVDIPGQAAKFGAHAMVIHGGPTHVGLEFFGRSAKPAWDDFVQQLARGVVFPSAPSAVAPAPPPPPPTPAPAMTVPSLVTPGAPAIPVPMAPPPMAPPPMAPPPMAPPPMAPPPMAPPPAPAAPPPPSGPYMGQDRRRAPRVELPVELRMRTSRAALEGRTLNLSMAGLRAVVADRTVAPGEPVAINLLQPRTNAAFRRDGVIVRVEPFDAQWTAIAIDFAILDPATELQFAEFLNAVYAIVHGG
jgi:hypothetical protein